MWWWRRKRESERSLLEKLLDGHAALETKRLECQMRREELELEHLEARNKASIELETHRQELRQKRREWLAKQRQKVTAMRASMPPYGNGNCRLCLNPMISNPTADEIIAHGTHVFPSQPVQ